MREILFRGKIHGSRKWCWGSYESLIHVISWLDENKEYHKEQVIPETVGQFTGLLDKNGTKIFEGDIVNDWMGGAFKKDYVVKFSTDNVGSCGCCVPEFDGSGFVCEDDNGIRGRLDSNCKVIGNIHDKGE